MLLSQVYAQQEYLCSFNRINRSLLHCSDSLHCLLMAMSLGDRDISCHLGLEKHRTEAAGDL